MVDLYESNPTLAGNPEYTLIAPYAPTSPRETDYKAGVPGPSGAYPNPPYGRLAVSPTGRRTIAYHDPRFNKNIQAIWTGYNWVGYTPETQKYMPGPGPLPSGEGGGDERTAGMLAKMYQMMETMRRMMSRFHVPHVPSVSQDYEKQEFEQLADLRTKAAQKAAEEANKIISHDLAYAKIAGITYNVSETQKKELINAIFSDYWDKNKESRFMTLAKKYDAEHKRFGWLYNIKFTKPLSERKGIPSDEGTQGTVLTGKKRPVATPSLTDDETLGDNETLG